MGPTRKKTIKKACELIRTSAKADLILLPEAFKT